MEERFATLTGWARRHFGELHITHRWATQDNDSTDSVPLVGLLHPRTRHVYVATGFGGWGMTGGIMAGKLLCDLITGRDCPWSDLYDPRRIASVVREGGQFLKNQAKVARHFVGDRVPPLASGPRPPVDDLAPGDGTVVQIGGRTWRCIVTRTASCTPSPPAAPTWAAWSPSTGPRAPGNVPATVRASRPTAPSCRAPRSARCGLASSDGDAPDRPGAGLMCAAGHPVCDRK
ncbi:hypothetical protein SGLAM104S_09211 [Streptomyces glaucescens]